MRILSFAKYARPLWVVNVCGPVAMVKLDSYREQLHCRPAWHMAVPAFIMRLAAKVGDFIPSSPMCSDTFSMLSAGNTSDADKFARLIKRSPKSYREFID